ncbi:MAG: EAL domain-containing protein [Betaproteobacteria bacterium]|nr:EAL domain-containing protein [Betaproteobacteria bacterium]
MSAKDVDPLLQKMDHQLAGWVEPAERLRIALAKDELALYCQPIAALSGAVRFPIAEVLVRLHEEEKAMLPPGEFLPVFEHYRLMPDLDRWVVRKVVGHLARGIRIPRFSINLSSQTIDDAAFPKAVALELVSAGVPGTALLFEISESDTLARLEAAVRFATAIRAVGCGVAVGGFGRRSATFAPLKRLQADFVKIDGVIVRRLLVNPAAESKLRAILRVGEVMGFRVIAEMVEDQDILTRLKALGVAYAQGFGIRQPHPIELIAG